MNPGIYKRIEISVVIHGRICLVHFVLLLFSFDKALAGEFSCKLSLVNLNTTVHI